MNNTNRYITRNCMEVEVENIGIKELCTHMHTHI